MMKQIKEAIAGCVVILLCVFGLFVFAYVAGEWRDNPPPPTCVFAANNMVCGELVTH
jgi:hypothetical protein